MLQVSRDGTDLYEAVDVKHRGELDGPGRVFDTTGWFYGVCEGVCGGVWRTDRGV